MLRRSGVGQWAPLGGPFAVSCLVGTVGVTDTVIVSWIGVGGVFWVTGFWSGWCEVGKMQATGFIALPLRNQVDSSSGGATLPMPSASGGEGP